MANEEHLKRLRGAIAAWNKWRKENHIIPLLGGADLSGANLENANLQEADLRSANLIEANLTGADLGKANLSGANLQGADLATSSGLTQKDIAKAKTDKTTKLPDYLSF